MTPIKETILKLAEQPTTIHELSQKLHTSENHIQHIIEQLQEDGCSICLYENQVYVPKTTFTDVVLGACVVLPIITIWVMAW